MRNEKCVALDFGQLYHDTRFQDITLIVGEEPKEFRAHKAILWARSGFFNAMFSYNMKESQQDKIRLPQVNANVFPQVLRYIYSGETQTDNLVDLLEAACFLQIDSLQEDLISELKKNVCLGNVFALLEVSLKLQIEKLKEECLLYSYRHAYLLLLKEKYVTQLSKESLELILKSDKLVRVSEMDLFKGNLCSVSFSFCSDIDLGRTQSNDRGEENSNQTTHQMDQV